MDIWSGEAKTEGDLACEKKHGAENTQSISIPVDGQLRRTK